MASKQTKRIGKTATITTTAATEQGRRLWLAGLGAFSLAQKRGKDVVEQAQAQSKAFYGNLVAEGKDLQSRTVKLAKETSVDLRAQATGIWAPITARIEKRAERYAAAIESTVANVLNRLGVPTKSELEDLRKRIATLSRQIKTAK